MSGEIGSIRSKQEYWQAQVDKWRESGLSQAEFCRQIGISSKSLGYWKRQFEQRQTTGQETQAVVAVPIAQVNERREGGQPIILHAWHDLRIEIPADFAPESLEKIIHVLGRLS